MRFLWRSRSAGWSISPLIWSQLLKDSASLISTVDPNSPLATQIVSWPFFYLMVPSGLIYIQVCHHYFKNCWTFWISCNDWISRTFMHFEESLQIKRNHGYAECGNHAEQDGQLTSPCEWASTTWNPGRMMAVLVDYSIKSPTLIDNRNENFFPKQFLLLFCSSQVYRLALSLCCI